MPLALAIGLKVGYVLKVGAECGVKVLCLFRGNLTFLKRMVYYFWEELEHVHICSYCKPD